jgi:uncharacterized protein (DUF58 family)
MPVNIDRNQLQEVSHLELFARQVVEGFIVGMHKSPFHGFSVEFAEHRQYNAGESTRHIDWKLYARTEKMYIKKYEEETNLRCRLVIDTSSSMYYPEDYNTKEGTYNKIKFSAYAAAAMIELLRRQRDAVGVSLFDEALSLNTQCKTSQSHHRYLYDVLEQLVSEEATKENKRTATIEALHEIAENTHRRSLVMIFSDMMDSEADQEQMFSAMQHLRHNKHEVILFHVRDDKTEMDFKFENRPHTFIDPETGTEIKAQPSEIKAAYIKAARAYEEELKMRCAQYRIDMVPTDIGRGFDQVLIEYLIKRKSLV